MCGSIGSSVAKESWEARGSRRRSRRNITLPLHACMVVCVGSTDRQRSGTCASDESQGQSCCIYGSLHLHVFGCAFHAPLKVTVVFGDCDALARVPRVVVNNHARFYESIRRSSIVFKLNLHLKFNLIACSGLELVDPLVS